MDSRIWYEDGGVRGEIDVGEGIHRGKTRPSIFMPRWASRLTLKIKNVRVEQVQEITHQDILAEGIEKRFDWTSLEVKRAWIELWNSINADRSFSWESNPWVWVIEFEVV
jgi:hypothetical protein